MKKPADTLWLCVTLSFLMFVIGLFLGMNYLAAPIQISVPAELLTRPTETQDTVPELEVRPNAAEEISFPIDINKATIQELVALPGIGEVIAERIIAYREKNGPFSAVEELLYVAGIGEKRFEEIMDLVIVGGKE